MSVEEERKRRTTHADPSASPLGARHRPGSTRADDAQSQEAKRQAAAEEHAAAPSKHAPHGNL